MSSCALAAVAALCWIVSGCGSGGTAGDGGSGDTGVSLDAGLPGSVDGGETADGGADAGDDAGAPDGGSGSVTEAFCSTFVAGLCSVVFACCDAAKQAMYGTQTACVADETAVCLAWYGMVDASVAAGRIVLDSAQLDACAAALATLSTTCDASLGGLLLLECTTALVGQVAEGGICAIPVFGAEWLECAAGECVLDTCEPWAAVGADCSAPGSSCDVRSHRCIDVGTALLCQAPLADGSACTQNGECASLYCAPPPAGTCLPFAGEDVCRDTG